MQTELIVAGAIAIIVLAWGRARGPERTSLGHYPASTRLRLYVPFVPWRDWISPKDHEVLRPLRTRANLGGPFILALPAILLLNATSPPSNIPLMAPSTIMPEPIADTGPEPIGESTDAPTSPSSTTDPQIDRDKIDELRTPIKLYGTAKVKPIYRLHDVEGAVITQIDPNSFWAILGVREGDVVIELHGEPVDNPEVLVALMNALELDAHVELAVRGTDGEVRYLEFEIPDDS